MELTKEFAKALAKELVNSEVFYPNEFPPFEEPADRNVDVEVTAESIVEAVIRISKENPGKRIAVINCAESEVNEDIVYYNKDFSIDFAIGSATVDVISSAAPDMRGREQILRENPYRGYSVNDNSVYRPSSEMAELISMLSICVAHLCVVAAGKGADILVIGAWGCGVLGNDPVMVADIFHTIIDSLGPVFEKVCYAVGDEDSDGKILEIYTDEMRERVFR